MKCVTDCLKKVNHKRDHIEEDELIFVQKWFSSKKQICGTMSLRLPIAGAQEDEAAHPRP